MRQSLDGSKECRLPDSLRYQETEALDRGAADIALRGSDAAAAYRTLVAVALGSIIRELQRSARRFRGVCLRAGTLR